MRRRKKSKMMKRLVSLLVLCIGAIVGIQAFALVDLPKDKAATVPEPQQPAVVTYDFDVDSWTKIAANPSKYPVGAEKTILRTTDELLTLVVLGHGHDDLANGKGKAGMTVGLKYLMQTSAGMNPYDTNNGGWIDAELRYMLLPEILATLPSDLQAVIQTVTKETTMGSQSIYTDFIEDKLFLFSRREVIGDNHLEWGVTEGEQYEYWRTVKDGTNKADRIMTGNTGTFAGRWWLRSPVIDDSQSFHAIDNLGNLSSGHAFVTFGVNFGFCVGTAA